MTWWAWVLLVLWGPSTALAFLLCGGYAAAQLVGALRHHGDSHAAASAVTPD